MPINAGHEFFEAEKKYLSAKTLEDKIKFLRELIKTAPKHKGSENLLAELKTRLKKFTGKLEKGKKAGKGKKGIKKEGYQIALVGFTNSGKSELLSKLTHATPKISESQFTTKEAELGTMDFEGVKAQIVDLPSIKSKDFDFNISNNADGILIVVENIKDFKEIKKLLGKNNCEKILVFNKIDLLNESQIRKLEATLKSKRLNYVLISAKKEKGISDLKKKILKEMKIIRIYTKEPGKPTNKDPVTLKENSTVKDVAETIYKGFSKQIKETRLTGPSGKFANQRVGLNHKLKDRDVVEFKT